MAFLLACAVVCAATLVWEARQIRRSNGKWNIGWHPLGGKALALAIVWMAMAILSLVDMQSKQRLFFSLAIFDHASRVNWTQSVLRTGVPPVNPLYLYVHPASMRYYYFWNVVCAAVVKMAHLSARAVFIASCVWAGFALAALDAIYLKYFLQARLRLRKQFLRSLALLTVAGIGAFVNLLNFLHLAPAHIEGPATDQVQSWLISLLYVPHHIASMLCCMLAFLLAWISPKEGSRGHIKSVVLIAAALASAFGLSIYVAFAFFLVMLAWALWQLAIERNSYPPILLAVGGVGALVLITPYLVGLAHTESKMEGGALFAFAIRQMIPPDRLMTTSFFTHFATIHPSAALNLAKLILLVPGYVLELGFYFGVLLMYLVPALRGRTPLSPAQRSLVFIAVAIVPIISFVRSGVLNINDFGLRAALLLQFSLLLCASEVITAWSLVQRNSESHGQFVGLFLRTPSWLRATAALALIFGVVGSTYQAFMLRFLRPLAEMARTSSVRGPDTGSLSHNAYISSIGYAQLDEFIPHDAVVQFNPVAREDPLWTSVDLVGIDHQMVIGSDKLWCGSELGGDPAGCPSMAAAIDALYSGATAEQAHITCRQYGIQYLVARVYDPAWNDRRGWVWTLKPVVADEEFRALDCQK